MNSADVIKSVSIAIVEKVPYPLGVSVGSEVLFLNEKARTLIGDCSLLALPRGIDQNTKLLYVRISEQKTLEVQTVHLGKLYFLLIFSEIDNQKAVMKDELTGLFSRQYLNSIGNRLLDQADAGKKIAVLFMDLDGFKEINDSLGHDAGDEVLKEVASRLLNSVRQTDLCFRWGGDEFVVISFGIVEKVHTSLLARRLIKAISEPVVVGEHRLKVGVSIGIAVYPDDGCEFSELLKKADTAMYMAKDRGGNMYNICGME